MSDAPGSYMFLDPGRSMGFSMCLAGGGSLRHGTWTFRQERHGEVFADYANVLRRQLNSLPDPQLALEMLTIVDHNGHIDGNQVAFTAGWYSVAHTICYTMKLREPEIIPIQTWRSKTHGKTTVPKELKEKLNTQPLRSKWFKQQAKNYCDKNGWSYDSDDEAEALCGLDALRIIYEPNYAFGKGKAYRQEAFL